MDGCSPLREVCPVLSDPCANAVIRDRIVLLRDARHGSPVVLQVIANARYDTRRVADRYGPGVAARPRRRPRVGWRLRPHLSTIARPQEPDDRRPHLQRRSPPRPRGTRGGAQAPRHVHRLHRHARSHAVPVGDHRQRRRRGAGRRRAHRPGDPAPRRVGRGARRRPRHPDRQRAQDRAARRRGGRDQAARRRQVRRRLVRRHGRSARRRPVGRQRVVRADGHRRRPVAVRTGHQLPPRRARRLRRRRAGRPASRRSPGCPARAAGWRKNRSGTRIRFWPDRQIFTKDATFEIEGLLGRARQTSFIVPGLELVIRDLRGDTPVEEKFRHDGGITEFVEFLSHDEPVTDVVRLQGSDTFVETVPLLDDEGPHDAAGGRARARHRHRGALGHGLRHRAALVRQRDRHPQGRHARQRLRAGHHQDVQRRDAVDQGAQGRRRRRDQGRRARGPDRRGHRAPGRAAVRGADQGDPRHAPGPQLGAQGRLRRAARGS